jgi:SAM-dependent methyltransferase
VEYPWVVNNLNLSENQRVLDIGSSSCSLLALLLASKRKYVVFATDIDDCVQGHIRWANRLGIGDQIRRKRFVVERQDATALTYEDETFDRITAVSTLEHMPDQEDTKAVKELGRVLKVGGLAVVTVPYNSTYKETFVDRSIYQRAYLGKPVFYERHYDRSSLHARLIAPSGLNLKRREYFGETGLRFERIWDFLPLSVKAVFAWMTPMFSALFIRKVDDSVNKGAKSVFFVLEKSAT